VSTHAAFYACAKSLLAAYLISTARNLAYYSGIIPTILKADESWLFYLQKFHFG
jgi:hypothetical protein